MFWIISLVILGRKKSLVPKISFPWIAIFIFLCWGDVGAAPKHWCDFLIHEVTLLDFGHINFLFILGQSPCNWRTILARSLYLGPGLLCMSGNAALEKCSSTKMFYCISKKQYFGIQAKFIDSWRSAIVLMVVFCAVKF